MLGKIKGAGCAVAFIAFLVAWLLIFGAIYDAVIAPLWHDAPTWLRDAARWGLICYLAYLVIKPIEDRLSRLERRLDELGRRMSGAPPHEDWDD